MYIQTKAKTANETQAVFLFETDLLMPHHRFSSGLHGEFGDAFDMSISSHLTGVLRTSNFCRNAT